MGRVIGTGGQTIKELQGRSGAKIQVTMHLHSTRTCQNADRPSHSSLLLSRPSSLLCYRRQIDQNFPDGVPRKIHVSGTQAAITLATQLISYVVEHGPTLPPLGMAGAAAPGAYGVPKPAMGMGMGMMMPQAAPAMTMGGGTLSQVSPTGTHTHNPALCAAPYVCPLSICFSPPHFPPFPFSLSDLLYLLSLPSSSLSSRSLTTRWWNAPRPLWAR